MLTIDGPADVARDGRFFAGERRPAVARAGACVSLDLALRIFGGVRDPDVEDPSTIAVVT